jgi:hypothetical protein
MNSVTMRPKFRLYVDEVGNHDIKPNLELNNRYLSLTGVSIELDHVKHKIHPDFEELKCKYFDHHPDSPIILHRKELLNKKHPFKQLRDKDKELSFNNDLLRILNDSTYTIFTVIIDKVEHYRRYRVWRHHPYHYCMQVMLERYVKWLDSSGSVGDVMAESRGGKEDKKLKASFEGIYKNGTDYVPAKEFSNRLSSSKLKLNPKYKNIIGLQMADLLAHPSYKISLLSRQGEEIPEIFGARIVEILNENKYYKNPQTGSTEGYGIKFLP